MGAISPVTGERGWRGPASEGEGVRGGEAARIWLGGAGGSLTPPALPLPPHLERDPRHPARLNRLHLPERRSDLVVGCADGVRVQHVEHVDLSRKKLPAEPE